MSGFGGRRGSWFGPRWGVRRGRNGRDDPSQLDPVYVTKVGFQIGIALLGDQILARGLAVSREYFVDHVHAFDDAPEGGEAHVVEAGVVSIVNEQLGRAGVRAGGGEDQISALVALNDWIILNRGSLPDLGDGGIGTQPELHNEAGNDAKESRVREVAVPDQVVKAVSAEGRPLAMHFDHKVARGGGELRLEHRWRLGPERCRVQQGWTRAGSGVGGTGLCGSAFGSWGLSVDEKGRTQNNDRCDCFHNDRLYETGERFENSDPFFLGRLRKAGLLWNLGRE
jgi:hypothetical protein